MHNSPRQVGTPAADIRDEEQKIGGGYWVRVTLPTCAPEQPKLWLDGCPALQRAYRGRGDHVARGRSAAGWTRGPVRSRMAHRVQSSIAARRWTRDDDKLLAEFLEEGKDLSAIALRMTRTFAAVQRRAADLRARSAFQDSKPES